MYPQHEALQHIRRLACRLPALRRLSLVTTALTLLWLYVLYWGERTTFHSHIDACGWSQWEQWPAQASPHRLAFIADPQLVDPHTYPGRPWPLDRLTERYTDMYMARNYRLLNARLDPDSIVFLGDLFDGGREWATSHAPPLQQYQRKQLEELGVIGAGRTTWKRQDDGGSKRNTWKRSLESYKAALRAPHNHHIDKKDHNLDARDNDLKAFRYGEDGRWAGWGQEQWDSEFERFGRIFFDTKQLYPHNNRSTFVAYDVPSDPVVVENGAREVSSQEYATLGGKQRRIIASLPGNHDFGLGDGVQWSVRDRFRSRFGENNRVDVIGNHTFISLDSPSLSAYSQYVRDGGETRTENRAELEQIWKPSMDFLSGLGTSVGSVVAEVLHEYFPDDHPKRGWSHTVTHPLDLGRQLSESEREAEAGKPKPRLPLILLSHVPLYRDPETDCGPLREKGRAIAVSAGYQYQNVLTRDLSNMIVQNISAVGDVVHIFSGDDHDYCDIHHRYNVATANSGALNVQNVREVTAKSCSWAMGVRRPGFQLVSLWNPVDAMGNGVGTPLPTIQSHLCLLPDQLSIFIHYVELLCLTLIVLLTRAVVVASRNKHNVPEADEAQDSMSTPWNLTRFKPKRIVNGTANGYATPVHNGSEAKGRQRASSISTSANAHQNSGNTLGVQRSYNARTRSVSPAIETGAFPDRWTGAGASSVHFSGPLIEKAGYYPQVRWHDPSDADSDEESRIGSHYDGEEDDSQAKWKRRRHTPGLMRRVLRDFGRSLVLVGLPSLIWYWWLIGNG